jgi:hypothetical protein
MVHILGIHHAAHRHVHGDRLRLINRLLAQLFHFWQSTDGEGARLLTPVSVRTRTA